MLVCLHCVLRNEKVEELLFTESLDQSDKPSVDIYQPCFSTLEKYTKLAYFLKLNK